MLKIKLFLGISVIYSLFFFNSCALEEIQPPTKTLMQGTWELIAATNDTGLDILNKVAFPVTALQ